MISLFREGEDRRELMELQYQVGRLELENMELEQHRIVHESILKGKDLIIQKLQLQLAVKDKIINRQQAVLVENGLDGRVGYSQLALMEQTIMSDAEFPTYGTMAPPSPPKHSFVNKTPSNSATKSTNRSSLGSESHSSLFDNSNGDKNIPRLDMPDRSSRDADHNTDEFEVPLTDIREISISSRDRDVLEAGDWSEVRSELSDSNSSLGRVPSNSQLPQNNIASNVGRILSLNSGAKGYNNMNSQSNHEVSAQHQGEFYNNANSKGVQGPRGGRHFRSASHEENSFVGNMSRNNSNFQSERDPLPPTSGISEKVRKVEKAAVMKEAHKRAKSEYFQIENSDDDSLQSGKEDDGVNQVRHNNFQSTPRVKSSQSKLDPIPLVQPSTEEGVLSGRKYEVSSFNQRRSQQALHQRGDNVTPRRNSNVDNDVGDLPSNSSIYPSLHPNRHENGFNRKGEFGPVVTAYKGGSNINNYNNRQQAGASNKDENSDWEDKGPNRRDANQIKGKVNPKKYYQVQPEKGTDDDEYGGNDMNNFNDALMVKAKPVIGMKPIGQRSTSSSNSSNGNGNGGNANGNYSNVRPQQPQPSGKGGGPRLANVGSNSNSSNNIGSNNLAGGVGGNNNALNLNVDGHSYGDRPLNNPSLASIAAPVGGIGNGAGIGIAGRQLGNKFRPVGR